MEAVLPRGEASRAPQANASAFPPLPFTARHVPVAGEAFAFEQWKRDCSHPVVLKGAVATWPITQNLAECTDDRARLHYLRSAFGTNTVEYTRVPADDPFMGY